MTDSVSGRQYGESSKDAEQAVGDSCAVSALRLAPQSVRDSARIRRAHVHSFSVGLESCSSA